MLRTRVIPCLLVQNNRLVKTRCFKNPSYVGDPINTVKIFNDKEVDEIIFLDIGSSKLNLRPNIGLIREVATEAFMPFSYGGGITTLDEASEILKSGAEKVIVNSAFLRDPSLISKIADKFGSQAVVVSIDIKKNFFGKYKVFSHVGQKMKSDDVEVVLQLAEKSGAGEIFMNSVDKDGTLTGYDLELVTKFAHLVKIPVIASGGAKSLDDMKLVIQSGASSVAAGAMFVYQGAHRAVLISYPSPEKLNNFQRELHASI